MERMDEEIAEEKNIQKERLKTQDKNAKRKI